MRRKPALNAFAITFDGRINPSRSTKPMIQTGSTAYLTDPLARWTGAPPRMVRPVGRWIDPARVLL
jgi:hypothetical protein